MFACLKKSAVLEPDKIRQSFAAINEYLLSEAVVHPPDFMILMLRSRSALTQAMLRRALR